MTREAFAQHKENIKQAKEDLRKILRSKADIPKPAGLTKKTKCKKDLLEQN